MILTGTTSRLSQGSALPAYDEPDVAENQTCISELMEAIDNHIPQPAREEDRPFLMAIEDVFSIEGRGTVATGRIERGVVKVNDDVEIVGLHEESRKDGLHRCGDVSQIAGRRSRR